LPDGDATDERPHPDTDAEHREGTPQRVAGQCPEGGPNYLNEVHARVSCAPCRTRRASPGAAWRWSPRRARPRHRLHHGHAARPSTPVLERDDHEAQGCRPSQEPTHDWFAWLRGLDMQNATLPRRLI